MTFKEILFLNSISILSQQLMFAYFFKNLNGFASNRAHKFLLLVGFGFLNACIASCLTYPQIQEKGYYNSNLTIILFLIVMQISCVFLFCYLFPYLQRRIIFASMIFLSIVAELVATSMNIMTRVFSIDENFERLFQIINTCGPFLVMLGLLLLVKRTQLFQALRQVLIFPNFIFGAAFVLFTFELLSNLFLESLPISGDILRAYAIVSYIALTGLIVFIIWQNSREKRLRESEFLSQQQQNYIQRLEKVQLELRKMHHDYKNVAVGLYAQVDAGELEAAKTYIHEKFLQVDDDLQLDILLFNQMANLEILELRTLMMSKVVFAEENGVKLSLDVMLPVKKIPMKIPDLLRCLDIILNNAIEAAALEETKEVHVSFIQAQDKLTIITKNPTSQSVDLQKIFQAGYSTKEANRGLGLTILKEISRRYRNFVVETRSEAGHLNQILLLQSVAER